MKYEHRIHNRLAGRAGQAREDVAAIGAEADTEIEALRKDAERYRYLRNRRPADVLNVSGPAAGCWIDCEGGEDKPYPLMLLTGADADAAIDAVMVAAPAVVLPNAAIKRAPK